MSTLYQDNTEVAAWDFPDLGKPIFCPISEENKQKTQELLRDQVIREHSAKMAYLDEVGSQIKSRLNDLDEQFIETMLNLMQKMVHKIILKELSLDKTLIEKMIKDTLEDINHENTLCVVRVSDADYPIFEGDKALKNTHVEKDLALCQGDFIIQTKLSELTVILERRLMAFFGIEE